MSIHYNVVVIVAVIVIQDERIAAAVISFAQQTGVGQ